MAGTRLSSVGITQGWQPKPSQPGLRLHAEPPEGLAAHALFHYKLDLLWCLTSSSPLRLTLALADTSITGHVRQNGELDGLIQEDSYVFS